MFVILLLLVMWSTTFTCHVNDEVFHRSIHTIQHYYEPYEPYGCKYSESVKWTGLTPEYSEPIFQRISFVEKDKFDNFLMCVKRIMSEERQKILYNRVDPFLRMIKEYNIRKTNKQFRNFYKKFVPTFNRPSDKAVDSITALLNVFNEIRKETSFYEPLIMGTLDHNVQNEDINKLINRDLGEMPLSSFQNEGLVGIIKIILKNERGVILLDMRNYKTPSPIIVMDNSTHELNTQTAQFYTLSSNIIESTFTYFEDYIIIKNTHKGKNRDSVIAEWEDILYTSRSLCSFVQSTEKSLLLEPYLSMAKYSSPDEPSSAHVIIKLETCMVQLYSKNKLKGLDYSAIEQKDESNVNLGNRSTVNFNLTEIKDNDELLKLKESYIEEVETGLEIGANSLRHKLDALLKICVYKKEIIKSINQMYEERLGVKTSSKSFMERTGDYLKRLSLFPTCNSC